MPREPIVLIRIRGISKLTPYQRAALSRWLIAQAAYVREHHEELADDYTSRCFSLPKQAREAQKESLWSQLRKWAGI